MEKKIGEIFECNGEWYQCVKGNTCIDCAFYRSSCGSLKGKGSCRYDFRKDVTNVIFKKLEKVGEPYFNGQYGEVLQEYKYYIPPITPDLRIHIIKLGIVGIEIKQNKEDMEEGKLDPRVAKVIDEATKKMGEEIGRQIEANINKQRMKPFNLEAAKAGKPVCTKDGRKARIICFDRNDLYPIVALIEWEDGKERIGAYSKEGQTDIYEIKGTDLMMLPEKKEGWVNVYNRLGVITFSHNPYDTKEEALEELKSASGRAYCVDTIKINWEE